MLKRAYRVQGVKEVFAEKGLIQLENELYIIDEVFIKKSEALKFAKSMANAFNKKYNISYTADDYFGSVEACANSGFVYNTETDEYEWLEL
jgi:hypothetical protein